MENKRSRSGSRVRVCCCFSTMESSIHQQGRSAEGNGGGGVADGRGGIFLFFFLHPTSNVNKQLSGKGSNNIPSDRCITVYHLPGPAGGNTALYCRLWFDLARQPGCLNMTRRSFEIFFNWPLTRSRLLFSSFTFFLLLLKFQWIVQLVRSLRAQKSRYKWGARRKTSSGSQERDSIGSFFPNHLLKCQNRKKQIKMHLYYLINK